MSELEVKVEELTPEVYEQWDVLIRTQECAVCGSRITRYTVAERNSLAVGCAADHSHSGFRQNTSYTEDFRRGQEIHPTIRDNIERKMMNATEFGRAMQLLKVRFPDSVKDRGGAALFINDCMRLGLDPLIQPAEAVPVAFKTKDKAGHEKHTVAMIITEDGALSMAARGCPDEYDGAPATMPLLDYLMREHPERAFEDLEKMAAHVAEQLCDDKKAYVWVALGKRRSATEINPVYGYFTQAEKDKAAKANLPAGKQPGNQARVRAVKHWVRETFPEARQKMLEYTEELNRRSEGVKEAQAIIDAEYRVLDTPDKKPALISPQGQKAEGATKTARSTGKKQAENKVDESAKRKPESGGGSDAGGEKPAAEPSGADETTLVSVGNEPEIATAREANAAEAGAELSIDWDWFNETLNIIKWSEGTCLSWITSHLDVPAEGEFRQVISHLPRDKAELLFREMQNRASSAQPKLM